ncbi:MAG: ribonuclease Z [Thermodesulfobacterium sp.]|uniref:Ribonuclease BN n=1 Tax=Candidatus Thermodesulfobacterium syntrophicum TaxID=3060442 RepID=A0AAE3P423_9BACT|nr:ribonuclease Z [Thermodesulfobacterium sp.]MDF2953491.1 Ribonuclease BN [Candidatus Thermodesulfobacterium syntrophicum]
MKITILGSGTGWIRLDRNSPGYLIEVDDFCLLLDLGPGVLKQVLRAGKKLEDISSIFISHFHPDHVTDLIPFLFATRYNLGYKRSSPVDLYVAEDFAQFYHLLNTAFRNWIEPPEGLLNINLLPKIKKYRFFIGPFTAYTSPVKHNPESLAIRLEYKTKSLVYSGDTGYCEELVELAEKADLLIVECANSKDLYVEHHLSPEDIALISERAKVRQIIFSHFYPHSERINLDLIKEKFKGRVILAEDLIKIEI